MKDEILAAGTARIPAGFSVRIDVRCDAVDRDGTHVVITRQPAREASAEAERARFVADFTRGAGQTEELKRGTFAFEDGTSGAEVVLKMEPQPGVGVIQRHIFRPDGAWVVRLTATVPVNQADQLDGPLATILRSYRTGGL